MIKLYQFPSAWGLAGSISPPCMKLETWLRIAGIPYEVAPFTSPEPQPPKGKWPFIDDGGEIIADSTLIIEHLRRRIDPDASLTKSERAIGLAFRRMVKESIFWLIIQIRHRDDAGFKIYRNVLLSLLAPGVPLDQVGPDVHAAVDAIRQNMIDQMHGHGMGRHTSEEVHRIGTADLIAISDFLGDKPFFFGDEPTGVDATVYAYLAHVIDLPLDSPSTQVARGRQNLVDYCRRMRARFYPETV